MSEDYYDLIDTRREIQETQILPPEFWQAVELILAFLTFLAVSIGLAIYTKLSEKEKSPLGCACNEIENFCRRKTNSFESFEVIKKCS